jgi:hypothetical protein
VQPSRAKCLLSFKSPFAVAFRHVPIEAWRNEIDATAALRLPINHGGQRKAMENSFAVIKAFQGRIDDPIWVEWREVGPGKKKVPYVPGTKRKALVNDPKSWGKFEQCRSDLRGIVFTGDGLGGIDLDACRDPESGALAPWAARLIKLFDSYSEVSPSGTGVKIFALGAPATLPKHVWPMPAKPISGKRPQIEAYVTKRFFTVTGNKLPDAPANIRAAPDAWKELEQLASSKRKRSDKAEEGRNGALYALGCRLQTQGKSDDEIREALASANAAANVELHPNFAEGALSLDEVELIAKSVQKRPKGESDGDKLERLNRKYCVVQDGGRTRALYFDRQVQLKGGKVVHERLIPTFLSFGDFHNYFKNERVKGADGKWVPLGNWWTGHPQRRTYLGLTFRPDVAHDVIDCRLNLWRGWGIQVKVGDWSLLRQHISEVIAGGNPEAEKYIMNWLAWTVQHPADRAEVALVLKGGRGVGKGTLGNSLVRIFGQHATHISRPQIISRAASMLTCATSASFLPTKPTGRATKLRRGL